MHYVGLITASDGFVERTLYAVPEITLVTIPRTGNYMGDFSPDATLKRGQFITMLTRAYDINPDDDSSDHFSDAGDTYYTGYLAAAKQLGISSGMVDNDFAPEQAISRQQMFTLLYNTLKKVHDCPVEIPEKRSPTLRTAPVFPRMLWRQWIMW